MFPVFSRPSPGAQLLQWQPLVLPSYRGDIRAVFVVGPVMTVRCCAPDGHLLRVTKPDAVLIQFDLLMIKILLETCRGL
jgi:hypothetical protein